MPESTESPKPAALNRRSLILGAVFLVGGAAALTRFARNSTASGNSAEVLSPDQFVLLEQVVDIIIPATDTPGALAAGVPEFIRQMLADWGSRETRLAMIGVLENVERQAWHKHSRGFLELPAEQRLEVMRAVDEDAFARQDMDWRKFKWLVLAGYYNSEIGATQELRYELVPGAWRSCLPLAEVGRAAAV